MSLDAFLIIGAQRSGTSLLTRMLNQHAELAVPPESFFFNVFVPLANYYGDLEQDENLVRFVDDVLSTPKVSEWSPTPTRDEVLVRLEARTQGAVFQALLDTWAASQGKTMWGEKTPHHVFFWDEIEKTFPDVPLVHIVRDGRDVALGLVRARFGPKSIHAAATRWAHWMARIEMIRARVGAGRIHEARYEDLLAEPQRTLAGICEFLDVPFDPEMLEFHRDTSLYSRYAADHANLKRPLLTDKIAAWRHTMRSSDVALFESVASEGLRRHGYPVETDAVPLSPLRRAYYRFLHHPPRKALGLLRNRAGHHEEFRLFRMRARLLLRYWLRRPRQAPSPR